MIEVLKEGLLLVPSGNVFDHCGVLNPAVIIADGYTHVFYRAVGTTNHSTIGYCKLLGASDIVERHERPLLFPQFDYECQGMEDPRIVKIDDLYYLTYTAYDGVNASGALAVSTDLVHFEKKGQITPEFTYDEFILLAETKDKINSKYLRYNDTRDTVNVFGKKLFIWDKNVIFFPRRVNGKLVFLHRIRPDIQIVSIERLEDLTVEFWQHYFLHLDDHIVLAPKYDHEVSYLGGGCPPIATVQGWLMIYHGVHDTVNGYVYSACAAMLDLDEPQKEISRLPYPLFVPQSDWEMTGVVNNVCFPTGAIVIADRLFIYYGAADDKIAFASVSLSGLIQELMLYITK